MEAVKPLFTLNLFNFSIPIGLSLVIQWVIMICFIVIGIITTRGLKMIPDKKQLVLETMVQSIDSVVGEVMGKEYKKAFGPFIGALVIFLAAMNLTGMVGFEPPTKDYSVALGMGLITFLVIQGYTIKKLGLKHYFLGYFKPTPVLVFNNIVERVMLPVSLSLRLFGNIMAAAVIMNLVYGGLGKIGWPFQLVIPIPLHLYLDLFDGTLQMVIFVMLSMVNIKIISEH